jgi:hypothetical protein
MLAVTRSGPSSSDTGAAAISRRTRSPSPAASAALVAGSATRNSSPPQAARHVPGPGRPAEPLGQGQQHLVAGGVAAGVVDLLEAVDVTQQHRQLAGGRGQALQPLLEVAAVVEAGEGVGAAGQLELGVAQPQRGTPSPSSARPAPGSGRFPEVSGGGGAG